ncbi:MAG: phasin family protein [Rhodobacteraceae bacterium]|nr:phasin family protein [Paracoccaceae bacterium]
MTDDKTGSGPFAMPGMEGTQKQMAEMFETMAKAQGQVVDEMMKQNIEVLGFVKERMEKDRAMVAALASAKDPAEAAEVWSGFWQKAMADYGDETGKLSEMVQGLAAEMLNAINPAAAEAMAAAQGTGKTTKN